MPLFGRPNVEKLKAKRDIHGLTEAAYDNSEEVRIAAASALAELGAHEGLQRIGTEYLVHVMENRAAPAAAATAAEALGNRRGNVLDLLALHPDDLSARGHSAQIDGSISAALTGGEPAVRAAIVRALGEAHDEQAIQLLQGARSDDDPAVSTAAAEALVKVTTNMWLSMQPRCSVCGLTSDGFFERMQARHAQGPASMQPLVQITNLVAVCPACRKAFCNDHMIAANAQDYFDDPKCPTDMTPLDADWDEAPSEDKPWRIGPRPGQGMQVTR